MTFTGLWNIVSRLFWSGVMLCYTVFLSLMVALFMRGVASETVLAWLPEVSVGPVYPELVWLVALCLVLLIPCTLFALAIWVSSRILRPLSQILWSIPYVVLIGALGFVAVLSHEPLNMAGPRFLLAFLVIMMHWTWFQTLVSTGHAAGAAKEGAVQA